MDAAKFTPLEALGRVLVVEDQSFVQDNVALHLTGRRLLNGKPDRRDIMFARSAEEGLTLLKGASFDLLLVDVGLPGMSGIDFVRAVRGAGVDAAVLVYSGLNCGTNFRDAQNAGADHVADINELFDGPGAVQRALTLAQCRRRHDALAREMEDLHRSMVRLRGAVVAPGVPPIRTSDDILPLDEICRRYLLEIVRVMGAQPKEIAPRLGVRVRRLKRILLKFRIDPDLVFRKTGNRGGD